MRRVQVASGLVGVHTLQVCTSDGIPLPDHTWVSATGTIQMEVATIEHLPRDYQIRIDGLNISTVGECLGYYRSQLH